MGVVSSETISRYRFPVCNSRPLPSFRQKSPLESFLYPYPPPPPTVDPSRPPRWTSRTYTGRDFPPFVDVEVQRRSERFRGQMGRDEGLRVPLRALRRSWKGGGTKHFVHRVSPPVGLSVLGGRDRGQVLHRGSHGTDHRLSGPGLRGLKRRQPEITYHGGHGSCRLRDTTRAACRPGSWV